MRKLTGTTALALLLATGAQAADLKLVEVITSPERTETLTEMVSAWEEETGNTVEIVSLPWGQALPAPARCVC